MLIPWDLTCSWAAAAALDTELVAMHWYTPASLATRPRILREEPRTICNNIQRMRNKIENIDKIALGDDLPGSIRSE